MRTIKFLLLFLISAGIALAQGDGEKKKIFMATVDKDGVQRVEVVGGEYFFDPEYIIVKKDIPVELIVKKKPGIIPHNIVIHSPDAGMDIRESMGSDKSAIKFTPTKAGKYPFYCDKRLLFFKNHREKGMEGIIEVTE